MTTAPDTLTAQNRVAAQRIRIVQAQGTVEVHNGEQLIARSSAALELHERGHDVRYYLPRDDVDLTALRAIDTTSHCPFKGDASDYWTLAGDESGTPVAWSYPDPIDASAPIAGHLGFYDTLTITASAPADGAAAAAVLA
ncbi:DUF427 domain-containing protein [Plantibacter sp. Mn2098]|uniref:DUF427 domain-containing protein n=1 Tax=Plantibacter sp. Mn2098 TaxID=3395266 RepID=UPI003BE38B56